MNEEFFSKLAGALILAPIVQLGNCGYSKGVQTDTTEGITQLVSASSALTAYLVNDIKQLRNELVLAHQTNRCAE